MTTASYNVASNQGIVKAKELDTMFQTGIQLVKACRKYNSENMQHKQILDSQIEKMISFFRNRGIITSLLPEEGGYDFVGEVKRIIETREKILVETKEKLEAAKTEEEKKYLEELFSDLNNSIVAEEDVLSRLKELQQIIYTMNLYNSDSLEVFIKTVSEKVNMPYPSKVYHAFMMDECMRLLTAVEKQLKQE